MLRTCVTLGLGVLTVTLLASCGGGGSSGEDSPGGAAGSQGNAPSGGASPSTGGSAEASGGANEGSGGVAEGGGVSEGSGGSSEDSGGTGGEFGGAGAGSGGASAGDGGAGGGAATPGAGTAGDSSLAGGGGASGAAGDVTVGSAGAPAGAGGNAAGDTAGSPALAGSAGQGGLGSAGTPIGTAGTAGHFGEAGAPAGAGGESMGGASGSAGAAGDGSRDAHAFFTDWCERLVACDSSYAPTESCVTQYSEAEGGCPLYDAQADQTCQTCAALLNCTEFIEQTFGTVVHCSSCSGVCPSLPEPVLDVNVTEAGARDSLDADPFGAADYWDSLGGSIDGIAVQEGALVEDRRLYYTPDATDHQLGDLVSVELQHAILGPWSGEIVMPGTIDSVTSTPGLEEWLRDPSQTLELSWTPPANATNCAVVISAYDADVGAPIANYTNYALTDSLSLPASSTDPAWMSTRDALLASTDGTLHHGLLNVTCVNRQEHLWTVNEPLVSIALEARNGSWSQSFGRLGMYDCDCSCQCGDGTSFVASGLFCGDRPTCTDFCTDECGAAGIQGLQIGTCPGPVDRTTCGP